MKKNKESELRCSCGGVLKDKPLFTPKEACERVMKEHPELDKETQAVWAYAFTMMGLMTPPHFVCDKCGKTRGFCQTLGQALLSVQELPQGAYARYKPAHLVAKYKKNKTTKE